MAFNPKSPPHNAEAEASVLGGIIVDKENIYRAEEILRPDDFYITKNRLIYENLLAMRDAGIDFDLITLAERLRNVEVLESVGGEVYLAELVDQTPMLSNFRSYCAIVRDHAKLRGVVSAAESILDDCYGKHESVDDVISEAERKIFALAEGRSSEGFHPANEVIDETVEYIQEIKKHKGELIGISTGFDELDYKTSGLQKSDLIYIAARPSMGKTAFALNLAQHAVVKENKTVAIFSLEMSRPQLMQRMLCSEGLIDLSKLRTGELDPDEWQVLGDASMRLYNAPLFIDDSAGTGVPDIRSKSRRLKAEHGLDLIVIDYLQLMSSRGRNENRQNEISEMSRGLKALAREMDCPVICLSQLSRAPDARTDHHPVLADLRESGSIEQDADIVMFLYRDYYYDKENGNPNMAELDIAKQRNGPTGRMKLTWRPEFTRFMPFADEQFYGGAEPDGSGQQ